MNGYRQGLHPVGRLDEAARRGPRAGVKLRTKEEKEDEEANGDDVHGICTRRFGTC
jgi:hypothetical protein